MDCRVESLCPVVGGTQFDSGSHRLKKVALSLCLFLTACLAEGQAALPPSKPQYSEL